MKRNFLYALTFLGSSLILSALQSSLYFSPLPLPSCWFIAFTYYSFRKSLIFSMLMNIAMCLVVISFSFIPPSRLLIIMNLMSFFFFVTKERFHTSVWHMAMAAGAGYFSFLASDWLIDSIWFGVSYPPLLSWLGRSVSTLIFAFPFVFVLEKIDKRIEYERVDTLENLRI